MVRCDHTGTNDRLARIERMIEHYRLVKRRRMKRLGIALRRKMQSRLAFLELERPPERVH